MNAWDKQLDIALARLSTRSRLADNARAAVSRALRSGTLTEHLRLVVERAENDLTTAIQTCLLVHSDWQRGKIEEKARQIARGGA